MTIGRSAAHSIFCSSAICVRPGQIATGSARGASGTAARSVSMSSGKRDHDRAGAALHRDVVGALDDLGNLRGGLDLRRPFGGRAEEGAVIHLLERAAPEHRALDLADEQDHRRAVVLGDMDAVGRVGRAGAAGDEADPGPAGEASGRQRHHRRARLLPADRDLDARIVKRVERGEIGLAGHAIDALDALRDQLIHENLPAGPGGRRRRHEALLGG